MIAILILTLRSASIIYYLCSVCPPLLAVQTTALTVFAPLRYSKYYPNLLKSLTSNMFRCLISISIVCSTRKRIFWLVPCSSALKNDERNIEQKVMKFMEFHYFLICLKKCFCLYVLLLWIWFCSQRNFEKPLYQDKRKL